MQMTENWYGFLSSGMNNIEYRLTSITNYTTPVSASSTSSSYLNLSQFLTDGTATKFYIGLGSGVTEPTESDFRLSSAITGLTLVGSTKSNRNNTSILTVASVYKNNTDHDVTVNEIGLMYSDTTDETTYLLGREVLDSSVTIKAGETYTFTVIVK